MNIDVSNHRSWHGRAIARSFLAALLAASALVAMPGLAEVASAAPASANLDQCANGGIGDPPETCAVAGDWVNGNLNQTKAHYAEGDSVPYRVAMDGLTLASHTVEIEFDSLAGDKHAIDYLTSFDRTVTTADPCAGVTGCSLAAATTFPIPADATLPFAQIPGVFTLVGGTITAVSAPSHNAGADAPISYLITFTATVENPVLAWGGHLASRPDWPTGTTAGRINGSSYHTRLLALDGTGGNQDHSLSAAAVISPAIITIIKDAVPNDPADFAYTTTGTGLTPTTFSLDDDADPLLSNTQSYLGLVDFTDKTVTETDPLPGFSLTGLVCVDSITDDSTEDLVTRTASIRIEEGEDVTCTFTNSRQPATLTLVKVVTNNSGGGAVATDFTLSAAGPTPLSGPGGASGPVDPGVYALSEIGPAGYTGSAWSCNGGIQDGPQITLAAGQAATCTITNDDDTAQLTLVKTVSNDSGGGAVATDFTLSAAGPTPLSGPGGASGPVNAGV